MTNLTLKTMLVLLTSLFVLGACGQKGPLYLPGGPNDPNVTAAAPVTTDEPATDATESDQEGDNKQTTE